MRATQRGFRRAISVAQPQFVFASDFFDNWSLIEEGTEDLAA